jgi:hypothetical protein
VTCFEVTRFRHVSRLVADSSSDGKSHSSGRLITGAQVRAYYARFRSLEEVRVEIRRSFQEKLRDSRE